MKFFRLELLVLLVDAGASVCEVLELADALDPLGVEGVGVSLAGSEPAPFRLAALACARAAAFSVRFACFSPLLTCE